MLVIPSLRKIKFVVNHPLKFAPWQAGRGRRLPGWKQARIIQPTRGSVEAGGKVWPVPESQDDFK
jgi:hypothetical protein